MTRRILREVREWTIALAILACIFIALHVVQAIADPEPLQYTVEAR